jgi:hypothetical protein
MIAIFGAYGRGYALLGGFDWLRMEMAISMK